MLAHEIEPFADAHILELDEVVEFLLDLELRVYEPTDEFMETRNKIVGARNALHRFKVCMVDEVEQKERYRQTLRDHKIRPNLKKAGS